MPVCPFCGGSPRESTITLDATIQKLEECENTIVRLENQGLIKFLAGIFFGFALGAVLGMGFTTLVTKKGSSSDTKDGIRQTSQSRAN